MRVVIVGAGGREHALATSCAVAGAEVSVHPGNAGIPQSSAADPMDVDADLVVIGPERALADGIADKLRARGRLVFGPGADGARLEASKAWMKEVVASAGIPTARHGVFTDERSAFDYLDRIGDLFVVKTDGLADGKGVRVTTERAEAKDAVRSYLSGRAFGEAGKRVIIEEGLTGPELPVLAVCDGQDAVALPAARDYKRLLDDDEGPNTGGMGAFSPVLDAPRDIEETTLELAIAPTLAELKSRAIDYRGVLYAGLMLTPDGPKLLEFNVRLGDPEAQVVLPRITSNVPDLLAAAAGGKLNGGPDVSTDTVVCVVCASPGYPSQPRRGGEIVGFDEACHVEGAMVFSSNVERNSHGGLVAGSGRVLSVCGRGQSPAEARQSAYRAVRCLTWDGMLFRNDVGRTDGLGLTAGTS